VTVCACHQPTFLPWAGFFHKLLHSDVFVILDEVQFRKGGAAGAGQSRVLIKTRDGLSWLTVPVERSRRPGNDRPLIREVVLADNADPGLLYAQIERAYRRGPFFDQRGPELRTLLYDHVGPDLLLAPLNTHLIAWMRQVFAIGTRLVFQSTIDHAGSASELLVSICQAVGADTYLTGTAADESYLDRSVFARAGISVEVQTFQPAPYRQLWWDPFERGVSAIDPVFNLEDPAAWLAAA
jgi:WbqC-like protein family